MQGAEQPYGKECAQLKSARELPLLHILFHFLFGFHLEVQVSIPDFNPKKG